MRKLITFISIFVIALSLSCTNKIYVHRIESYFNASTVEEKEKYLAADYRSHFLEKKDSGTSKLASLASFQEWDAPLHPDIEILHHSKKENVWTVQFNEQNAFSKLIDFPGWKATEVISFNEHGLIKETIYIPDPSNPSYKTWLQPAVDWLQKNKSSELNEVYQNGKLIQTTATANKWVSLLKQWRQAMKE